jgi:hypothetical protein
MTTPFSLSDEELDRLMAAAAMLPQHQRTAFVRSVAGRVADVGLVEIESAIEFTLNAYGVVGGPAFKGRPDKAAYARRLAERIFR